MPFAVIVVKPERVDAIRAGWVTAGTILVFTESEILHAFNLIRQRPPKFLVLDRTIVTTSRGAMLAAQVMRDPRLRKIELRVLNDHDGALPLLNEKNTSAEAILCDISKPLDHWGTRHSWRWTIHADLGLRINGEPGRLIDLSSSGAQIMAAKQLRPEETVRLTFSDGADEIRVRARVARSSAVTAGPQLRYRAGIEFMNSPAELIETLCIRHGNSSAPVAAVPATAAAAPAPTPAGAAAVPVEPAPAVIADATEYEIVLEPLSCSSPEERGAPDTSQSTQAESEHVDAAAPVVDAAAPVAKARGGQNRRTRRPRSPRRRRAHA